MTETGQLYPIPAQSSITGEAPTLRYVLRDGKLVLQQALRWWSATGGGTRWVDVPTVDEEPCQ